jgi:CheY-like chemotaxis protein
VHPVSNKADRLRILLVEDHEDTRLSMQILLRKADYLVKSAESGRAALEAARESRFDVLITDLGLPDIDGRELAQRLHESYGMKVIAVTGYERGGQPLLPPFLNQLTKPIDIEQLRDILAQLQTEVNGRVEP